MAKKKKPKQKNNKPKKARVRKADPVTIEILSAKIDELIAEIQAKRAQGATHSRPAFLCQSGKDAFLRRRGR